MTIQELIDLLNKAQDKSKNVLITDTMELVEIFEPIVVIEDSDMLLIVRDIFATREDTTPQY